MSSIEPPGFHHDPIPDGRERDILGPKKREAKQRVVSDQYGALPYRFTGAAALEVLIVTTRQLKRWIYRRVGRSKG